MGLEEALVNLDGGSVQRRSTGVLALRCCEVAQEVVRAGMHRPAPYRALIVRSGSVWVTEPHLKDGAHPFVRNG